MAVHGRFNDGVNVLEHVTLGENHTTATDLEGVAGRVVPVVVDLEIFSMHDLTERDRTYCVKQSVALNLGAASTEVVDVVALESDEIARAIEVDTPVSVAVTCGAVRGDTVKVGVGDGHAVVGAGSEDEVLTADTCGLKCQPSETYTQVFNLGWSYRNVVNPDHISFVEGDGIASPDIFGVDVGDGDVPGILLASSILNQGPCYPLDDDVASTADDSQTFALDDTAGTIANDCLVRGDSNTENTGIVTVSISKLIPPDTRQKDVLCHRDRWRIRFVVGAPVILVDGNLARRSSTPGSTSSRRSRAFSTGEIEAVCQVSNWFSEGVLYSRLVQDNHTGRRVSQIRDQLIGCGRVDWSRTTTSSDALCKAFCCTSDADSRRAFNGTSSQCAEKRSVSHDERSEKSLFFGRF